MVRLGLLLCLAGCSNLLGIDDLEGPADSGPNPPPPGDGPPGPAVDCKAQRTVHLVGGTAGLAWFTLIWPVPGVIKFFQPTYAYDDPGFTKNLTVDLSHELFIRTNGAAGVWEGTGTNPQPSIFIAGQNETHTNQPTSAISSGGNSVVAAGAALQVAAFNPRVPVIAFGLVPYGNAPGAPVAMAATDVEPALTDLQASGTITAAEASTLRPSSTQLARYFSAGAPNGIVSLGTRLAFAANAFKSGLLGTVVIPAFNDDPHGAFATAGAATTRANQLATVLDAFYTDLAAANEADCGNDGEFLSLADNVVMMVTGDTLKNSYVNGGWPDGTAGNANAMYLRSNGYTKFGWFGELQPGDIRLFWDPNTGQSGSGDGLSDTNAAWAGALYAIARGNRLAIAPYTSAPFEGVISPGF